MNIRLIAISCVLLIAVPTLTVSPGCSIFQVSETGPRRTYFELQEAYILAVSSLIEAKRVGEISQNDWDTIWNPAIQAGNRILDDMDAAVQADDPGLFNIAESSFREVIIILEGYAQ